MKFFLYLIQLMCSISLLLASLPKMDDTKLQEGKTQYELIVRQTEMPNFGKCWKNTLKTIQIGCKSLTDVVQTKLALSYLNCFLQIQGRPMYECQDTDSIEYCTRNMGEADRSSFATFFTHTQNICYFLEAQMWQERTEETIDKLSDNSAIIADQLEESAQIQELMISKQNTTLDNQEKIISKAVDLNNIITSSSDNIHGMFDEFKKSTQEQRLLINDVFDRVTRLQTMVLGEISGFYSIVYYTLSIIICYLLTSTPRTSGARFWMFGMMTINFICERVVVSWIPIEDILGPSALDSEEKIYALQWMCRKFALSTALVVLMVCAYRYEDINKMNNMLLLDIKKQNSELKSFILSNSTIETTHSTSQGMIDNGSLAINRSNIQVPSIIASADTTGYESEDSGLSGYSSGSDTSSYVTEALDSTFAVDDNSDLQSETGSLSTVTSYQSSATKLSLLSELRALKDNPTVEELHSRVSNWVGSGYYRHSTPLKDEGQGCSSWSRKGRIRHSTPSVEPDTSSSSRYNLRPRKSLASDKNPVTNLESPRSFSKTVKRLEKIAVKNSMLARFTIEKTNH